MKKKVPNKVPFKNRITKNVILNLLMTVGIFIITIIAVGTGTYLKQKYNLEVGAVSPERFVSDIEVINKVATDERIKEETNKIMPLYNEDPDIKAEAVIHIQTFFADLKNTKKAKEDEEQKRLLDEEIKQNEAENATQIELENQTQSKSKTTDITVNNMDLLTSEMLSTSNNDYETPVFLDNEKFNKLIGLSYNELSSFEEDIINVVLNILGAGVREDGLANAITINSKDAISKLGWDNTLKDIAYIIASSVIEPNFIIDEEGTKKAKDAKIAELELTPIKLKQGEKIVDKGEIITEEIYAILDSLGYTKKDKLDSKSIISIVGLAIIIALLQAISYEYIKINNKKLWLGNKEKTMLFTIYCLIVLLIRVMTSLHYTVIPIALFGMLVAILIDLPLAILLNIVISIVGTLIYNGNSQFLIYFIISGTFACMVTKYTYERNNTIKATSIICIINAIVIFGIGFLFEKVYSDALLFKALMGMLSGIIAVIVMTGSLPFWEAAFDAITPIKLLELTNPNQPILKRLIIEAPGTYHHSIIVANLAEMASMDIRADGALARAGAYYHDIGKLKYPNYFSENQAGENPHDYLLPLDSAKIIIEHVEVGNGYAIDEKLPKVVRDIINQHHGNTLVKYFFYKAKKDFPSETIKEEQYRYSGIIPQFKEAAIVMMADTVEAAVRSMVNQGKNMDEIKDIIGNLIKDKLDDGQLRDSNLTLKDLDIIQNSFMKVFRGMYHGRIAYPKEAMKSPVRIASKEKIDETEEK